MMRLIFLLPLALFGAVAAYFLVGLDRDPHKLPSMLIDQPAPQFALPALRTDKPGLATGDLAGGKGTVRLVNFFASWCMPCREEHPILTRLAAQGVAIDGVNYKDKPDDAMRWLGQLGDPYARIGADVSGRTGIDFGVYGVPETYVVDGAGKIRYRQVGPITPKDLQTIILPLLAELKR